MGTLIVKLFPISVFPASFGLVTAHHRMLLQSFWRVIIIHMVGKLSMQRIGLRHRHLMRNYMIMVRIRLIVARVRRIHRVGRVHLRMVHLMHWHGIGIGRRIVV